MSTIPESLQKLQDAKALRPLDRYFADFISRASGSSEEQFLLAAALASRQLADGHVCLDLPQLAGKDFPGADELNRNGAEPTGGIGAAAQQYQIKLPGRDEWLAALQSPSAKICVGLPGERKPLILDGTRLYLHRYHQYEMQVAQALQQRAAAAADSIPPSIAKELYRLSAGSPSSGGKPAGDDRQRLAAFLALRNRLTVITGGPGTGKTFTVARIIALFQLRQKEIGGGQFKIKIAAPTGKAAARVAESIQEAKGSLADLLPQDILGQIPTEASTIHRLLGKIHDSPDFRHNRANPIDADLVIIDEASMIDLAQMAKLLAALRPDARLILLGDMDQLESVEPGSVFGDICQAAQLERFSPAIRDEYQKLTGAALQAQGLEWKEPERPIDNCVVRLYHSHRFPIDGPIGSIAAAINQAEPGSDEAAERLWKAAQSKFQAWDVQRLMEEKKTPAVLWHDAAADNGSLIDGKKHPRPDLRTVILAGYKAYLDAQTIEDAFDALQMFRVFCAVRRGRYGVETVNRLITEILAGKHMVGVPANLQPKELLKPADDFYHKRLIMVTHNDYSLGLFNGDTGIVWEKPESTGASGQYRKWSACFESTNSSGAKEFRRFAVNILPEHETAFAITVHKAQGSQFGSVMLLLPPQDQSRIFSRELLYTALTRPQDQALLWCTEKSFQNCVKQKTQRQSGLLLRLKNQLQAA